MTRHRPAWKIFSLLLAAAVTSVAASQAAAEVEGEPARSLIATGPEGRLGTLRLLETLGAPPPAKVEAQLVEVSFCEETEAGCRRPPRVLVASTPILDLSQLIKGRSVAYLGARLTAKRAATVHLLLGLKGEAVLWLDGAEVLRASGHTLRHDQFLARLELSPGDHALALRLDRPARGRWRAELRLLDERFRPGAGEAVEVDLGRLDQERSRELVARAVRFDEVHSLDEGLAPEAVITASLPAGGLALPVEVQLDDAAPEHLTPDGGLHRGEARWRRPLPEGGRPSTFQARAWKRRVTLGRGVAQDRLALLARAALLEVIDEAPAESRAPLAWRADELGRVVREGDPDRAWRQSLTREAKRLSKAVRSGGGENPFAEVSGYERMAFFSRLDGKAQPYELFVPPGYSRDETRRWPLVITLHGFKGNAGDYFRNTFGLARDARGGETLLAHGRHGKAPRRGPMIVIAPTGRGQAMYRQAGEVDVLEALADAQKRFRVDPRRIYITGGSMGGTGAAYLPYRNPDLFAASAALAGYHDQRVRRDTDHEALSPVERFLEAERSDVDWAENGLHLPTLLVRGTRDRPLAWTRRLVERLRELGYPMEHREPELGHNVWTETYAEGAIFRYFAPFRLPEDPRQVRFRTARERSHRMFWVNVDARAAPDEFADVDALVLDDGQLRVTTGGVQALTLSPSVALSPEGPLTVEIDGQTLSGERPLSLQRGEDDRWELIREAFPRPGHKRPGVSGPIRDVYHEPLVFVVGTLDEDHTLINRLVARHWARPKGWTVDYPIIDDVDVTEEMVRTKNLVLIGPPSSNALTRRYQGDLPIRFEGDLIRVGDRRHGGLQVGTVFVAPNPEAPDQALLVIAGPSPLGTWRSLCLPDILPDYVVFDEGIAEARGQWSIGGSGAHALEAGLFEMDWSVPQR